MANRDVVICSPVRTAIVVMIWWVRMVKYREVNKVLFDPHQKAPTGG